MIDNLNIQLSEEEFDSIQIPAHKRGMTAAEWIRETLMKACGHAAAADINRKLAAIRSAYRFQFPTGDMDQILNEVGRGTRRDA